MKTHILRRALLIAISTMVCILSEVMPGCAEHRASEDVVQLQAFLLKPRRPVSAIEYRVYPPDELTITSIYVPEINGVRQQVRPDGKVNVPLLGEIAVAGYTPAEIETALQETAKQYYRRTDAKVVISRYNSQKFVIMGQVAYPGPRIWTGRDTLLDVLAQSQPLETAWYERIRVLRSRQPNPGGYLPEIPEKGDKPGTPYNNRGANEMTVNLMAMIRTGDMSHNIIMMPGDVIYVPPNPWAAFSFETRKGLLPATTVTGGVLGGGTTGTGVTGLGTGTGGGTLLGQ